MTLRFTVAAAVLLMVFGCGGSAPGTADLKVGTTDGGSTTAGGSNTDGVGLANGAATGAQASNGGSSVAGKLAPALAPPSALIVLEPQDAAELPVKAAPAIMDQAGYEFLPAFLLAQAGQVVQFRNSEDVLHNVRVTEISSQKPVFNVATVAFGKYEHTFDPGYFNVTCDIHTTMRASILVTTSPYTATTTEDGSFTISNVRPGKYNLTVYAGPAPVVRSVEVKSTKTDLGTIQ